ncbi:hypothetical protein PoB_001016300 [Plakobranchus ocellatus]|uniref:Uncharacterized protein n=1 Tax=Plakobranchus ocellatus TaxID=259542 RepID=A0AAV3YM86_9GAST|nr:hypothetical protein PoB_001016300 [Plakobranchus ocellatus]
MSTHLARPDRLTITTIDQYQPVPLPVQARITDQPDTLRLIAEDRPKWNALVAEIRKTAEAARSDDPASGRL